MLNPVTTQKKLSFTYTIILAPAQMAMAAITGLRPMLVKGHVLYDGKKTDEEELPIDVKPQPTEPEPEPGPEPDKEPEDVLGFPYEYIILGVLVGTLLLWWMRRRT